MSDNYYKKFLSLFYPERIILLGILLIVATLIQTTFYGYTSIVNPNLKLFESR
ncbi:MAG: hypothetical protein J4452_01835 [Candidatus Aenigmarchaeota archaeon]|nr:hypothetical protein [Candidatus Aenigmarchaeota archaeon]